ncbi:hypothetical protein EPYR_03114 [Erwinia pyrifoliae DSM 12163]|nr:hypothetical protein EJP617_18580 [Erwinia sp. Ejp617]CAY75494.1 hypothetical protein EPYR_03114 [Erwinia pyrifoliae DSM 12163]
MNKIALLSAILFITLRFANSYPSLIQQDRVKAVVYRL